jgi:hypothetical protein
MGAEEANVETLMLYMRHDVRRVEERDHLHEAALAA